MDDQYVAFPSQEREVDPAVLRQTPHSDQACFVSDSNTELFSQARSGPKERYQDANQVPSNLPSTQAKHVQDSGQTLSPRTSGTSKKRFIEPVLGRYIRWKTSWKLQTIIIGFFLLALACAAAHCSFFVYLDGRILAEGVTLSEKTTTIPQGYVTTISLLLTTAFRAALLASVGVCYTQCLWAALREHVFEIGLVEDLFQIQTNAFHLISPGIYYQAPILAAVAVFCWVVPIATVYPPGALIVGLNVSPIETVFNVSVLHVIDPTKDTNYASHVWCTFSEGESGPPSLLDDLSVLSNASFLDTCYTRIGLQGGDDGYFYKNQDDAPLITRSTLMSGEIARWEQPGGGNISYDLEFWGPTLQCKTTNRTLEPVISESDLRFGDPYQIHVYHDTWMTPNLFYSSGLDFRADPLFLLENTTITYRSAPAPHITQYKYYPCLNSTNGVLTGDPTSGSIDLPDSGVHILIPISETVCHPSISRYSVTIAHSGGNQHINHTIHTDESIPKYVQEFQHFNGSYEQWVQFSDAMIVYDEFARNLNRSAYLFRTLYFEYQLPPQENSPYSTKNGTTVDTCLVTGISSVDSKYGTEFEIWPLSVFERRLVADPTGFADSIPFDADLANDLLINSTISMLSLNRRFDTVNGTVSRAFNAYHFRNKVSFYVPYGLSLGLAIPIIVLGLSAFYLRNQGVSAITGGFLQLLMTTTGRTELESIIARGSGTMGGHENVTQELTKTKIRFGQLIEIDNESSADNQIYDASTERQEENVDCESTLPSSDSQDTATAAASGAELSGGRKAPHRRAGFGMVHEVQPFRKKMSD